jgi:hypothetical protein
MSIRTDGDHGRSSWYIGKGTLQALVGLYRFKHAYFALMDFFVALHEPYVLAFEPHFVEIRHIETGLLSQVIQGSNLRLLFADTPPSVVSPMHSSHPPYPPPGYDFHSYTSPTDSGSSHSSMSSMYSGGGGGGGYLQPPYPGVHPNYGPRPNPQGVGRDEILIVSADRVLALRTAAGPQRHMSDTASMMSIPR